MQQTEAQVWTRRTTAILGVRFDCTSRRHAVEQILTWIAEGSRRMVITAGPEFVMKAQADEALRKIAFVADMVTPDGIGVVWAARRAGMQVERVTGVELVEDLLAVASSRRLPLRVYILGAAENSLESCLKKFRETYPDMKFQGHNGYFAGDDLNKVLQDVAEFQPHLWLVGMGQPRQEQLIFDSLGLMPPCVGIGVGGSIDVWGGTVRRAPLMVQQMRLEWLYRLLKEPSRWRRQLALPRFAWKVLRGKG